MDGPAATDQHCAGYQFAYRACSAAGMTLHDEMMRPMHQPRSKRAAAAGMALATMFVTLPFVVRELIPILETMDLSQVQYISEHSLHAFVNLLLSRPAADGLRHVMLAGC
jgi:hypothetical protein